MPKRPPSELGPETGAPTKRTKPASATTSYDTSVNAPDTGTPPIHNPTPPPLNIFSLFPKWTSSSIRAPDATTNATNTTTTKPTTSNATTAPTTSYPPLPPILDTALETAALTHSGLRKSLTDQSYERLEWIGDVYLELIASELIYTTFPTLDPGRCSQLRELLVRNATLGQFALHYGLDARANFPAEFGLGGRAGGTKVSAKQRAKALGDIFEAYVGALVRSDPEQGLRRAAEWLRALWGPVLERHVREEEEGRNEVKDVNAKTQLEQLIGAQGVRIEYRDLPSHGKRDRDTKQELFFVGCFLHGWGESGLQLGYGGALGKKEAGQKAALKAMENKKLIKKFAEKKAAFVAARAAAQAEQAEQAEQSKTTPSTAPQ